MNGQRLHEQGSGRLIVNPGPRLGLLVALAFASTVGSSAGPVAAAPVLRVMGRVEIRLTSIEQQGASARIRGEVLDRDLRQGLPGRRITLVIASDELAQRVPITTDGLGRFDLRVAVPAGMVRVAGQFDGDASYAPEVLRPRPYDLSRQTLDLSPVDWPAELDAERPSQTLRIRAMASGVPVEVPLVLQGGRGEVLARMRTGSSGQADVVVATAALGAPGPVALVMHFAGDAAINPASRRVETLLVTRARLTLSARESEVEADGQVRLFGRLVDARGPVPRAAVSVTAMGQYAGTGLSDEEGRFDLRLPAAQFSAGTVDFEARHDPDVLWRRAGRSAPVEIRILAPEPIQPLRYLIPVLLTAVILLGLLLHRSWDRLVELLRSRAPSRPGKASKGRESGSQPVRSGVRLSRTTIRSLITPDFTLSGEVWDATDGVLIPGARVELRAHGRPALVLGTGLDGRFRSEPLPEGPCSVAVGHLGHVTETFTVQIPHRGGGHGMRIDLVQVRVRLLELYRRLALPQLPRSELWGCWTPRELVRDLNRRLGRRILSLDEFTALLETCYWGAERRGEELLERAEALGDRLIRDLPAGPRPPTGRRGQMWFYNNSLKSILIMAISLNLLFSACGSDDGTTPTDGGQIPVPDQALPPGPKVPFTLATWNVRDFFDETDDPTTQDTVLTKTQVDLKLKQIGSGLRALDADIVALQEVENETLLKRLVQTELGSMRYIEARVIEGKDMRGIDVALLSRYKLTAYMSNQGLTFPGVKDPSKTYGFSRDCVEAHIELGQGRVLKLLINHLRSGVDNESVLRREAQAKKVRQLAGEMLISTPQANLAVLGDMNDTPDSDVFDLLVGTNPTLTDVVATLTNPKARLTYKQQSQLDYILLAPGLASDFQAGSVLVPFDPVFSSTSDHYPVRASFVLE